MTEVREQPERFTEDDEKRYVDALNFIALEAKFGDGPAKLDYGIKMTKHFSFLQSLVGKIHDNIFEVKKLHQPKKKESEAKTKKSTAKESK